MGWPRLSKRATLRPMASPARPAPRSRLLLSAACLVALLLASASASARAEVVHVVAHGQTLGRIAKRYHVTVEAIREVNGLRPGQQIHPGLSLVIPEKGKEAEAAKKAALLTASKAKKGDRQGRDGQGADRTGPPAAGDRAEAPAGKKRVRPGFVRLVRGPDRLEVQLVGRHGHLAPAALAGLSNMLRFYPTGARIAIDPRLAALVARVSDHFGGRPIHVVSGFRPYSPVQYTPHSNHNVGRAMDFSIEGIPSTTVRDFCRTFRDAGVGFYPNSTFVHLDVRTGKSYWIDYSRSGEAPRYDSPSSQGAADEAARDVEPHTTVADPPVDPPPGSESDPGSYETP
jgi:LysM repeat protein